MNNSYELEKNLKEQLESVIKQNQMLLEKYYQQDSKIIKLIEENNYYKEQLQQKDKELEARKQLINKQDKELYTLEHTIKEVREYIEKNINRDFFDLEHSGEVTIKLEIKGLLEILDKVEED